MSGPDLPLHATNLPADLSPLSGHGPVDNTGRVGFPHLALINAVMHIIRAEEQDDIGFSPAHLPQPDP